MEPVFAVMVVLGVLIWLLVRDPKGRDAPAARARAGPAVVQPGPAVLQPGPAVVQPGPAVVQPLPAALPPIAPVHDDAAFFDGYVWGRLQERRDERQHDAGHAGGHDDDMFDADDGFDDDS